MMQPNEVRWKCRRGMLELDAILNPFFEQYYSALSPEQKNDFVKLLECSDPDLWAWLSGKQSADEEFKKIIGFIRKHSGQK